jgi:Ca2+-binding EF-hand superfamily protein
VTSRELEPFFKRFDKDQDTYLRYSEFCEAFLPVDSHFAALLAQKQPSQMPQAFSHKTEEVYRDVWLTHFRNEVLIEQLRQDNRGTFNAHLAFEAIDTNHDGYICKDDVSSFVHFKCLGHCR